MDLIQYTSVWAKGDLLQGRIMFGVGILLLIAAVTILTNSHTLLKGTLIPMGLAVLILVVYGGFLAFSRSGHLEKTRTAYAENQEHAIQQEYDKAIADNKNYTMLKPIWIGLIIISAILFFVFKTDYLKGLSMGLIGLFFIVLVLDTLLQYRLKPYLEILTQLNT